MSRRPQGGCYASVKGRILEQQGGFHPILMLAGYALAGSGWALAAAADLALRRAG